MSLLDNLGDAVKNAIGGQSHQQNANPGGGNDMLGNILANLKPEQTKEHIATSAQQMTPEQRGGLLGQLLGGLGNSGANIPAVLSQLGIDPKVADHPHEASADDVAKVASHTQNSDPSIFQRAMAFYNEHPTLVQSLGAVVLAQAASHFGRGTEHKH